LLKGEVNFQDQRPERLRFRVLVGVDAVTRPYEEAESQGQQQGDETDDRADHALRVGHILNWQQPLEEEADQSAREGQQDHDQASGQGIQTLASCRRNADGVKQAIAMLARTAMSLGAPDAALMSHLFP
jgi:hypothetical protein